MMNFLELEFHAWFRNLSRIAQWVVGIPIVMMSVWASVANSGVQQGFLLTLLIVVVVTLLLDLLLPKPKIEGSKPAGLGDFSFPTTTEGRVVPLCWGRVRQKGPNVIWYGDLFQEAIRKKVKTGLLTSKKVTTGFRYHLGMQMALVRGPNVVLKRVWIGDDIVFDGTVSTDTFFDIDKPLLFGGEKHGSGGVQTTVDFYTGSKTQIVNAYLDNNARQRVASAITPTAPRYTGLCYVVARRFSSGPPLITDRGASLGTSTSIKAWSFEIERYTGIFTGQGAGDDKVGVEANPVNVIYEILTNTEWGFGFAAADIDLPNFLAAADIMITEVNGFSMLLDRTVAAKEVLKLLQEQIDGVVFLSQTTGKWTIKLARADFNINTVPQLTDENVVEVQNYSRGTWEDTTNTVSIQYDKREDDYKLSFAFAQDMANAMIQGDGTVEGAQSVVGTLVFPGVKSSALASNLAWRELRGRSFPLARAKLVVKRQMWDVSIGDTIAWTNAKLGFVKLPMRVMKVDYGKLQRNRMVLEVVQDVFQFAAASMGTPAATGWVAPVIGLVAFPADEQVAVECPRAILVRDPDFAGDDTATKIICAARLQGSEVSFLIRERHAAGAPAGAFAEVGEVFGFMKIGQLKNALTAGVANPTASILLTATPDSQVDLEAAFDDTASDSDLGQQLVHLILVGTEYMLVRDAANSGADVNLQSVFRGELDSGQAAHAAGTDVFLLLTGTGITDGNFVNTDNVDIELRMQAFNAGYTGAVTTVALLMAKRALRPYPPAASLYNGGATQFGTPDLEGDGGAGENTFGFDVDWFRRRFDTSDELAAMLADDTGVVASHETRVRVFVDPSGANTEITGSPFAWATGSTFSLVPRLRILELAAAGTEIRVQLETRHDIGSEVDLVGRHVLAHDVVPTGVNDGLVYLGGNLRATDISNVYTTAANGVFTVRIGGAYSTSDVEHRINGGSWTAIIAASATSGVTASLTSGDTIEVRHTVNEAPDPNFISIDNPSAARVAYGTLSA